MKSTHTDSDLSSSTLGSESALEREEETTSSSGEYASGAAGDGNNHGDAASNGTEPRERIAARAYELYLQRGGDHGRDTDDWLEAERELSGGRPHDGGAPELER